MSSASWASGWEEMAPFFCSHPTHEWHLDEYWGLFDCCSGPMQFILPQDLSWLPRWLSGKRIPGPMQETQVWSLGQEDPLEKEMAIHFSILAWEIPWTEEPGGLQSTGLQWVGHDWSDLAQHRVYWIKSSSETDLSKWCKEERMVVGTQEVLIKMGRTVQIKMVDHDICTKRACWSQAHQFGSLQVHVGIKHLKCG